MSLTQSHSMMFSGRRFGESVKHFPIESRILGAQEGGSPKSTWMSGGTHRRGFFLLMDSHLTADHSFFEMLAELDRIYKANRSQRVFPYAQRQSAEAVRRVREAVIKAGGKLEATTFMGSS